MSDQDKSTHENAYDIGYRQIDTALEILRDSISVLAVTGNKVAETLDKLYWEFAEGKACLSEAYQMLASENVRVGNERTDLVIDLALNNKLKINDPDLNVSIENTKSGIASLQEDLYQCRIQSENQSNELHFARELLKKNNIDCTGDHGERIHYGIERLLNKAQNKEKTFAVYWDDGRFEFVQGSTFAKALTLAGYSQGATRAIDFYDESDTQDPTYTYDKASGSWTRTV